MTKRPVLGVSLVVLLAACGGDGTSTVGTPGPSPTPMPSPTDTPSPTPAPTPGPKPTLRSVVEEFSFANDSNGFQAGFADYTPGQESAVTFSAMPERLPSPLGNLAGYAVSGANPSADVFLYIWKLVTGLTPNTDYTVTVSLHFATNAPPGCPSGPGENVTLKAGAASVQPANVTQANRVTVNFDKGNQATGGANAAALGNFAQTTAAGTCAQPLYAEKTLTTGTNSPLVTSDANGQLWLVIGLDSGFAGTTKVYFLDGAATFSPSTS
jgi:hypothetical protein